jgi:predicted O-linked N-acetylglucosamine transferase (SPINDLY family)
MPTISQALAIAIQHHQAGRLQAAEQIYRRILQAEPNQVEAHINLGAAFKEQGKLDEAVACYRRALELKPDLAEAHSNLGNALKQQGKLDEAVACHRRALELKPDFVEAHNNLGNALKDQGKLDEAVACFRRALELKPGFAAAHNNLGNVFNDEGKLHEAIACFRRALELKPDFAEAHNNLGNALEGQGRLDDAVACCRRALELKPDYVEAHNSLGIALIDQGRLDEAIACYRRALELKPDFAATHDNVLSTLQYCTGVTPAALAEAHAEYDRRYAAPLCGAFARRESVPDRHGRLRLGFVSPDLGRHPVGYFLVRVLENLSQEQHETICYSDRIVKDDLTHRLQAAATQWRDVIGMSDQRLAEQVREDRIDILFDLAGHTAHNRLLVFARKPATIQVTWAGYVGTTGLKAMDYLLADHYEIPPGAERHYQERVLRMPEGYVCYDPPAYAPAVTSLPALDRGQVTFGCFNKPAKITPQAIDVWAKILRRLPRARLVLKYKGCNDNGVVRRFAALFVAHAVDPGRIELLGYSPHAELLAEYNRIDLALDSFPYSGGLTTCEALWMGVPVVTCPGETFASRHSLSHLSNVGLTETIAEDLDEYVELAVSLAGDLPRLAALRAGLRQRMAGSPLCDGKRFAANLASVLQGAWTAATDK